jgi:hypothetical protein
MESLNFFRQADAFLRKNFLPVVDYKYPVLKTSYEAILEDATKAQKFILPDGGRIIDDNLKGLPDVLNLPYPVIVIEYEIKNTSISSELLDVFGKENITHYGKRIAIASQPEKDGPIAVTSIVHHDDTKQWVFTSFIHMLTNVHDPESAGNRMDKIGIRITPLNGMQGLLQPDWEQEAHLNLMDETRSVLELMEALSCSNVSSDVISARKTNKSAIKKGALPFDDYRVLVIKSNKDKVTGSRDYVNGSSRSPREHLRRGHARTYESGLKIWVQSCVVNPDIGSKITKTYNLQG